MVDMVKRENLTSVNKIFLWLEKELRGSYGKPAKLAIAIVRWLEFWVCSALISSIIIIMCNDLAIFQVSG